MGYNTVVLILNDRLDEIKNDPYFGPKLVAAIQGYSIRNKQNMYLTGQTEIIGMDHADVMQILAVGANTGTLLGKGFWTQDRKTLITNLYNEMLQADDPGS